MVPGLSERDRIAADVRRLDWLPDAIGGPPLMHDASHRSFGGDRHRSARPLEHWRQRFAPAAPHSWRHRLAWGVEGSGEGEFSFPTAVAVDANGGVFVVDTNNHRVLKFTPGGAFIGAFESFGSGPGEFRLPLGIGVDAAGFVYVSDTGNHRIQKFEPV